ncbi:ferredoxin [Nocardioides cavernae]|uniref:Ferredoxin n=1 Tax=Nocardioides cavernae TaxID=1921566 RepID=A0A7Y9H0P6_9ACTN|nr:ferredoxin [Nocardioides cavernae]NYE35824.1 ferredoxin [Nocardioides cavernae]
MRVDVDMDVCQNYGQCVFAAPEVFDLDDAGDLVYQGEVDDASRTDVEAAVMACPVQAIAIPD